MVAIRAEATGYGQRNDIKEAEGLYEHDKIDAGGFINALRVVFVLLLPMLFLLYSWP